MKKKISILGATGSIGVSALSVIDKKKFFFNIILLSSNKNFNIICKQIKKYKPKYYVINNLKIYNKVKKKFKKSKIKILNVFDFDEKKIKSDIVISAIPGIAGLSPTINVIKKTKKILIANKEAVICGWNLIKKKAKKNKTEIIPIDSEHYSIHELIKNSEIENIEKIFLTASGGPFLNYTYSKLSDVKIAQALKHPTWNMGKKISVDSSTMMNKLFEVIEAKKIFNIPYKKINIIIHPKSYVHALVRFNNGITKILVHDPDMKIPIHNSLYYKRNMQFKTKSLNFKILNNLDFKSVNYKKFPLLKLLNNLPKNDSLYETVLVTINDFFVSIYLNKKIDYKRLVHLIYSYSNKKIFHKFKKKIPKNVNEIYKTKNFVYTKLSNWGI
jgi:1-deoxy-D-xylulose-5-phosphate reductoisomerase